MRRTRCRAVALAMLLLPAIARARPGDLDPTWSGNGIVTTDLGSASDTPNALALQSDGKVVVVGAFGAQYVVRYRVDGTLDADFGSGGIVTNPSGTCRSPSRGRRHRRGWTHRRRSRLVAAALARREV
jgi:hypothetical protein